LAKFHQTGINVEPWKKKNNKVIIALEPAEHCVLAGAKMVKNEKI
jgi:hypothetical protein